MRFFIPGNVPSSKNSRVWTGRYFVASKQTTEWRKNTETYWKLFKDEFKNLLKDKTKPYKIKFKFIRSSKHRFDYINPLQTIQDEMVSQGWLDDDNSDILLPIFETYEYSKESPGVEISIDE